MATTVTSMYLSSFLGTAGTIYGTVGMAAMSTAASQYYQHYLGRGGEFARRKYSRMPRRYKVASALILFAGLVIGTFAVTSVTELFTGKPVSALVQGQKGHGFTLGGGNSGPEPGNTPSITPSVTYSTIKPPTSTPTALPTPTVTPSETANSPIPASSPQITPTPSFSPAPTPSFSAPSSTFPAPGATATP